VLTYRLGACLEAVDFPAALLKARPRNVILHTPPGHINPDCYVAC
jgi:hypothetical protein